MGIYSCIDIYGNVWLYNSENCPESEAQGTVPKIILKPRQYKIKTNILTCILQRIDCTVSDMMDMSMEF